MKGRSLRVVLHTVGLTVAAVAAGWWLWARPATRPHELALVGALVFCTVAVEARPLRARRGRTGLDLTASSASALALLLVAGPLWAAGSLAVGALLAGTLAQRTPWRSALAADRHVLAVAAATWAHLAVAGTPPASPPTDLAQLDALVAALAATTAFGATQVGVHVLNRLVVRRAALRTMLRQDLGPHVVAHLAALALGPVAAHLGREAVWLLPLLVLPLAVAFHTALRSASTEHRAMHDGLTGLPNRSMFHLRAHEAMRGRSTGALLLVDLDRFKIVNDTLGHHAGDQVLRALGPRLANLVDEPHTVARLGGDEFGMVLPGAGRDEALAVADRVVAALVDPVALGAISLDLGASIGVVLFPDHGHDVEVLIHRADLAMYHAKENGRDWSVYSPELDASSPTRLTLVSELHEAIEQGQLVLHYQPKVSVATGAVEAVEALVRWEHPQRGLILPGEFLDLAEQTGLVHPLTEYVLGAAMAECARWHAAGFPVAVAVNVSTRVLHDVDLAPLVAHLLRVHRPPAGRLVLEVTEHALAARPEVARRRLQELHEIGAELALDDFGSGPTDLARLAELPVAELKLDPGLVHGLTADPRRAAVAAAAIDMGRRLGLRVVAEGVETEATWRRLQELGCHTAQGYLFSRPLAAPALTAWMDARRHQDRVVAPPADWVDVAPTAAPDTLYGNPLRRTTS